MTNLLTVVQRESLQFLCNGFDVTLSPLSPVAWQGWEVTLRLYISTNLWRLRHSICPSLSMRRSGLSEMIQLRWRKSVLGAPKFKHLLFEKWCRFWFYLYILSFPWVQSVPLNSPALIEVFTVIHWSSLFLLNTNKYFIYNIILIILFLI